MAALTRGRTCRGLHPHESNIVELTPLLSHLPHNLARSHIHTLPHAKAFDKMSEPAFYRLPVELLVMILEELLWIPSG